MEAPLIPAASRIGVVVNTRAGANRRDPKVRYRLERALGDRGLVVAPRNLDELGKCIEDFKKHEISLVGIAGGDGTNHVTITLFAQVYGERPLPLFAFLRGGTMNTVANALGLPRGRPEHLLDRIVVAALEKPAIGVVERPMMNIEGKLGFLWGTGLFSRFLEAYYATGNPSPFTAAKTLGQTVLSALVQGRMIREMTRPLRASVYIGRERMRLHRTEHLGLAAGTVPDLGLGFRPFCRALERNDAFHFMAVYGKPLSIVRDLGRVRQGKPLRPNKADDALIDLVSLEFETPEVPMMIDGDLIVHPKRTLTIQIGPIVRIVRP